MKIHDKTDLNDNTVFINDYAYLNLVIYPKNYNLIVTRLR